jgi:hypothetical protein
LKISRQKSLASLSPSKAASARLDAGISRSRWEQRRLPKRPRDRILEKQNHLLINVRMQKKLESPATAFAFQGF